MNRKLESNRIIENELSDYWDRYDECWDWDCDCDYCSDSYKWDREWYYYYDWLEANTRRRKIDWFLDESNTLENNSTIIKKPTD